MSRPLDLGINQIKNLLIKMGQLADETLELALRGFFEKQDTYVRTKAWSNTILILAEEVEDRATELLALHQPMATDLRTLKAYIKIAYDLERYGRYAMDISDIMNRLGAWQKLEDEGVFKKLADSAKKCVDISIETIRTMNEKLIWELSKIEAETDILYLDALKILSEVEAPSKTVVAYLLTIRYLERIADHSSYVSEAISYAVTGKRVTLR
jgi:phosphate transport system protein